MNNVERAVEYSENGFNCAQSVFSSYAERFGLDQETALKIAVCFGGGIGQTGRTCGAVSGALMTLGLKYGTTDSQDKEAKAKNYERAREFMEKFSTRHHSIMCRELLDCDISTPEGHQYAREHNLFSIRCRSQFIRSAAEILEEMLEEE